MIGATGRALMLLARRGSDTERSESAIALPRDYDHGRVYATITGLLLTLAVLGAVAFVWVLWRAEQTEVRRDLERISITAAEQVADTMQMIDVTLQDAMHRIEIAAARAGVDPDKFMSRPEARSILIQRAGQVRQLDALTLIDAQGRLVNTTRPNSSASLNLADRDYFIRLQQEPAPDLYVTLPLTSRLTGLPTVLFNRRLDFGTRSFRGVVQGAMPIDSLRALLWRAAVMPHVAIRLERRQDGGVLARVPALADGEEAAGGRLVAVRDAGDALRLTVSVSEYDALASWRRQATLVLIATASVVACVLLMLFAMLRQFRVERTAQAVLTRRNDELETARGHLERQTAELEHTASALREGEKLLAERSATLNITLEYIAQGIMMVDGGGRVRVYNKRMLEILELPEELLARSPTLAEVLQYQMDQGEFAGADPSVTAFLHAGGTYDTRKVFQRERPNGTVVEFSTMMLPGGGIVRTYTDITDLRRAQEQIERAALFDELTGLPNRLSLRRKLQHCLDARADGVELGLLYMNLDRFRLLNDARGHGVGDQVLIEVARRLGTLVGEGDMVSRAGGDEFAIMYTVPAGQSDGSALGQRLLRLLAESYVIDERPIALTVSVGIAISNARASPEILLRNSEIAMYRAKDAGRDRLCRYEAAMAAAQEEQFQLEQSLRESLGTAAFRLDYQPIVSLENDEITGFEALLRWTDRVRGDVSPSLFIPIAEATGLIVPLGRSVLEWACLEAAGWSDRRAVAVNLSPAQFQGGALPRLVRDVLGQSGLPAERLELEVTEGMLLEDTGPVHETMFALRDLGVSLTLDDFGTGHAGLSYLRRFPFSKIKIDRSFIRNLGTGGESDVIVEEMILLGRRLNLRVVAEGVELQTQLERLRSLGCAYVQGYLTGRPVAPEIARHL